MSSPGRVARAVWGVFATLPPAAGAAVLFDSVRQHPVAAALIAAGYEGGLLLLGVAAKVYGKLQERWIDRAADRSDRFVLRLLARYGRVYRYYIRKVHHDVDIRGLSTQGDYALSINDVFVDVNLQPSAAHTLTGQVLDPTRPTAPPPPGGGRESLWDVVGRSDNTVLAVLGAPGGGKTTLLKHVALELAARDPAHRLPKQVRRMVPILLFLREHAATIVADPDVTIADLVRSTLKRFKDQEPPGWFDARLAKQQCFVMLDGLDEVADPGHRVAVVRWVESQIAQYRGNRFIITSRPHGYQTRPLNGADVVRVLPFTDDQIERFIHGWYLATETRRAARSDVGVRDLATSKATDLLRRVRANPSLSDLAVNPLLLTMIAHVHSYRGALPGTRVALYREICDVFLGRRDEGKGLAADMKPEQKHIVLQHLAFAMMQRQIRDISTADAAAVLREPLSSVAGDITPKAFLRSVEQSSGLICEPEPGVWSFAHLTFQEFLASVHISESNQADVLARHVTDDWWRELTLLYVAQADADLVVRACLAANDRRVTALALAADCVDAARQASPALRARVEQALSAEGNADSLRRVEVAQVFLTRRERHAYRAAGGLRIFSNPVSEIEWNLYRQRALVDPRAEPVLGMRARDAVEFVRWTQTHGRPMCLPTVAAAESILQADGQPFGVRCVWATTPDGKVTLAHRMAPISLDWWASVVEDAWHFDYGALAAVEPRAEVQRLHDALGRRLRLGGIMWPANPDGAPPAPRTLRWTGYKSSSHTRISELSVANAVDLDGVYRELSEVFGKDLPEAGSHMSWVMAWTGYIIAMNCQLLIDTRHTRDEVVACARLRGMLWAAVELLSGLHDRGGALMRVRTRRMHEAAVRGLVQLVLWEQRTAEILPPTEGLILADPTTMPTPAPLQRVGDSDGHGDRGPSRRRADAGYADTSI